MCGRYTLTTDQRGLQQRFAFHGDDLGLVPREQIYPTNTILTVVQEGPSRLGAMMHWGFLPPWAKGRALINAQAEKLATSNTWRRAFLERRCLVLADGFYEWRKNPDGSKTMMWLGLGTREPFAMAGLWGEFENKQGDRIPCATIITTAPNELMAAIHDRMPAILTQEAEALWLDPMSQDPGVLGKALAPFGAEMMASTEYSPSSGP